jgi:hypothetical protein
VTTWCYVTEDRTIHNHHCENLKSYKDIIVGGVDGQLQEILILILNLIHSVCQKEKEYGHLYKL